MRSQYRHLFYAGLAATVLVGFAAAGARIVDVPVEWITREPQTVLDGSWYVGGFSNLGGVVWFATGGILVFAAAFGTRLRIPLAGAAIVTWLLGLDDIFLLHDAVYPKLGAPESVVVGGYFLLIAILVWRTHTALQQSTLVGVGLAVFFWIASQLFDRFLNHSVLDLDQLTEDGAKFVGAAIWAAAWINEARLAMTPVAPTEADQAAA